MQTYGPLAFGVVTFLIIWFAVVMPMLKLNKSDRDKDLAIAEAYNETAEALRAAAEALRETTLALVEMLRHAGKRDNHTNHNSLGDGQHV
jgi:hypothetical protein